MATDKIATQVSPFHNAIDLSSTEGKKLYKKLTQGLPYDEKQNKYGINVIAFVDSTDRKGEDFGWKLVATDIGPNNLDLFKTPGKMTIE